MVDDKRLRREATTVPEMARVIPGPEPAKTPPRKRPVLKVVREEVTADLQNDERVER